MAIKFGRKWTILLAYFYQIIIIDDKETFYTIDTWQKMLWNFFRP